MHVVDEAYGPKAGRTKNDRLALDVNERLQRRWITNSQIIDPNGGLSSDHLPHQRFH
jgi:hypothetical protein